MLIKQKFTLALADFRKMGVLCTCFLFFLWLGLLGGSPVHGMGSHPAKYVVGVRTLAALTPDNASLSVMVFYPANRSGAQQRSRMGVWRMQAELNAPPARLVSPVILLSHDMVDLNIVHHELATALAGAGFIVLVPVHAGDNSENASAAYSAAALYYRPLQMREALDALLREPVFSGLVDTSRVGLLGVGAGALTVLQLCGVDLDYDAHSRYCNGAQAAGDEALCSRWAISRMYRMGTDMAEIRKKHGKKAFVQPVPNVKAVGLLSPGWLSLANKSDVAFLRVPLAAFFAGQGGLYPPVYSGEDVLAMFPRPLYDSLNYQIVPDADHYSLYSNCPPEVLENNAERCGRLTGKPRSNLGEKRNAYFVTFFQAALGVPVPEPKSRE